MSSIAPASSDYRSATEACGLLDRSERGKLALGGADAKSFLQGQVSNDVEALRPGAGCYAAFLTPKGKMLGDLRILDAGDEILLDTERVALQELFNMIRRFSIGFDVELHKRTLESGLLSLLGPESDAIAAVGEPEHSNAPVTIGEIEARAIRTDVGIDLLCAAADVEGLRAALGDAGVVPVSEAVAECLRVERGRPRFGVDLDAPGFPKKAGLKRAPGRSTKGCSVG